MSGAGSAGRLRRIGDWCLIALFSVVLVLPTLDWALQLDRSPTPNENRNLAPFPAWGGGAGTLQPFIAGLESWFNDHFGFRKRLVRLHSRWLAKLFGASASSDVVVGRDGWLYFAGGRMIDNRLGALRLSADDLRAWQALLETRRDWLATRGIAYLFVVAPNKETIYPEHLPAWIAATGAETKLDQFVTHMRAHSSVEVLDLRPVLIEAKSKSLVYYRTDSHWNDLGAFLSSQAVVETLGRQLPGGLAALPRDAYELTFGDGSSGDLARLSGGGLVSPERDAPKLVPRAPLQPLEVVGEPALLHTERAGQRHRVVLFGDSFANAWHPLLGQSFARVLYVHRYSWDAALIERERPNAVVDEIAERHLNQGDPRDLLERDALSRHPLRQDR